MDLRVDPGKGMCAAGCSEVFSLAVLGARSFAREMGVVAALTALFVGAGFLCAALSCVLASATASLSARLLGDAFRDEAERPALLAAMLRRTCTPCSDLADHARVIHGS